MRLANAADEIEPLQDPRVQSNATYLTIILLSRVITELGDLDSINNTVIENLFVRDLEYLQNLYERINQRGSNAVGTACPDCGHEFQVDAGTGTVVKSAAVDAADPTMTEVAASSSEEGAESGN